MKHLVIFISFLLFASKISYSWQQPKQPYTKFIFDAKANAKDDLNNALLKAKKQNKNILVIIGGDWNYWSRFFNKKISYDSDVKDIIDEYYVYLRINYSPANKNEEILNSLECPRNEGYPIFIILDKQGKIVHKQNAEVFIADARNNYVSFTEFIKKWIPNN